MRQAQELLDEGIFSQQEFQREIAKLTAERAADPPPPAAPHPNSQALAAAAAMLRAARLRDRGGEQLSSSATAEAKQPSSPASAVGKQASSPATTGSGQPSSPATTAAEQLSSPASAVAKQASSPATAAAEQPSSPASAVAEQLSSPATTGSGLPSSPAGAVAKQPSSPATTGSGLPLSPATAAAKQLSSPASAVGKQASSPATAAAEQLLSPASAAAGQPWSPATAGPGLPLSPATAVAGHALVGRIRNTYVAELSNPSRERGSAFRTVRPAVAHAVMPTVLPSSAAASETVAMQDSARGSPPRAVAGQLDANHEVVPEGANASPEGRHVKRRRPQRCSICGQLKKGHACLGPPKRPLEPVVVGGGRYRCSICGLPKKGHICLGPAAGRVVPGASRGVPPDQVSLAAAAQGAGIYEQEPTKRRCPEGEDAHSGVEQCAACGWARIQKPKPTPALMQPLSVECKDSRQDIMGHQQQPQTSV